LSLINDILDFSKIDAGKLELEILDFNHCSLLGDFVGAMDLKAQEKKTELILDVKGIERTMVQGDPGRLRQVLTNLVSNALKFIVEGEVVIRANLQEISSELRLNCEVIDTGIGIPASKQAQLFDSFTQVDT
jgi:two-component system sensor histidine kinase/response regulator